ncbi:hypothetical protein OPV22_025883 [Ensete ventricosum]|uniref:Nucleotide exchange factor Fes1 domain-containing protein n=1 Tax=Ensete ventricosum TaxID=4639 RepID=A0AAV8P8J5_ENSVE|nr:hypothetical protein OPV22_025883 [Ensete ventricosum]
MAGEVLKWDGLLRWSLSHADGIRPARILSEEDRKWLVEALQAQTLDVAKRMKEIQLVMSITEDVLELQGIELADIVEMLDELGEHVGSIDMTNDLRSVSGLVPLLGYLKNSDAGIGAKGCRCCNYHCSEQSSKSATCNGVLSSLIQNNQAGSAACDHQPNGDPVCSERVKFPWRVHNLVQYLLLWENNSDCSIVVSSVHVREAAVGCHLEFAGDRSSGGSTVLAEEDKLKEVLQQRIEGISG